MIIDAPKVINKDEWVWNQYLQSSEDDSNNRYHYDKELKKVTLNEDDLEKAAAEADVLYLQEKMQREKKMQSLLQEQSVLEATINSIKQSNYVD